MMQLRQAAEMKQLAGTIAPIVRSIFQLGWTNPIHGVSHWSRVCLTGRELAEQLDVNPRIPVWFAFLHDSCRDDDGHDPEHGMRAAGVAGQLRRMGYMSGLANHEFEALHYAIEAHSDGEVCDDRIVQVCWDADRLDLGRIGIRPAPALLSSVQARQPEFIARATARSQGLAMHVGAAQEEWEDASHWSHRRGQW